MAFVLLNTRPAPCWAAFPTHLDNLLLKKQPLYSLIPISIIPPKHQHLAFICNKSFHEAWLYPLHGNAEPHTVLGRSEPTLIRSQSHAG